MRREESIFDRLAILLEVNSTVIRSVMPQSVTPTQRLMLLCLWGAMQEDGIERLLIARSLSFVLMAFAGDDPPDSVSIADERYLLCQGEEAVHDLWTHKDIEKLPRPARSLRTFVMPSIWAAAQRKLKQIDTILRRESRAPDAEPRSGADTIEEGTEPSP